MKILTDNRWIEWKSVQSAWDISVKDMTFVEQLKTIGRPIYAFYNHCYSVEYVAFYLFECRGIYQQKVIDKTISYCEWNYPTIYNQLSEAYAEILADYKSVCDELNIPSE